MNLFYSLFMERIVNGLHRFVRIRLFYDKRDIQFRRALCDGDDIHIRLCNGGECFSRNSFGTDHSFADHRYNGNRFFHGDVVNDPFCNIDAEFVAEYFHPLCTIFSRNNDAHIVFG